MDRAGPDRVWRGGVTMDRVIRRTAEDQHLTSTVMDLDTFATLTPNDAVPRNRSGLAARDALNMSGRSTAWTGGVATTAEGRALFARGWQDGAARAQDLRKTLDGLIPAGTITRRRRVTGDDGDDIRLDAVLAGNWDHAFTRRATVRVEDPSVISLATGWIAPARIDHEDLIWSAVQAIALTDALESAGYRVEFRAVDGTTATKRAHQCLQLVDVMVKRAEDPMRADLLAAMIGHAGCYRTLGFLALWTVPLAQQETMGECMYPHEAPAAIQRATDAGLIAPVSYYIPRAESEADARRNVLAAVEALFPGRLAAA